MSTRNTKTLVQKQKSKKALDSRIAVYPGSFDPITLGHVNIIKRISELYDEVIVLIAYSSEKKLLFTAAERVELAKKSLKHFANVKVDSFEGLTVDYAQKQGAKVIVRGLRAIVDFEYEAGMGNMNKALAPDVETVLVFSAPEFHFISSRMVKEVAKNKGSVVGLVPDVVVKALRGKI